jgi:hypothetical protein
MVYLDSGFSPCFSSSPGNREMCQFEQGCVLMK